jgi:ribosomal protein S27E
MDGSPIRIKCPRCAAYTFATITSGPGQVVTCCKCSTPVLEYEPVNGYMYVHPSNPAMVGLLKIGFTARSVEDRVTELNSTTAVPAPFVVEAIFASSQPEQHEKQVHQSLAAYRMEGREFFRVEVRLAVQHLVRACGPPSYLRLPEIMEERLPPAQPPRARCRLSPAEEAERLRKWQEKMYRK